VCCLSCTDDGEPEVIPADPIRAITSGWLTTRPQPYLRTFTFHNAITGSHQVDILKGYLWAEPWRGKSIAGRRYNPAAPQVASFVRLRRPVEEDGHGVSVGLVDWRIDQKALPIAAHVINKQVIH